MVIAPLSLHPTFWETFTIQNQDLEFLYNYLLEIETPLTSTELIVALVEDRIRREREALENHHAEGASLYVPKDRYELDQYLVFPALQWRKGRVIGVRSGSNPEIPPFDVIEVLMDNGESVQFASGLDQHRLNQPLEVKIDDPLLDQGKVLKTYGTQLVDKLETALRTNPDLVQYADHWFPRSLLLDINVGHLNLAEAVLDMSGGGPLNTKSIIDQIELPTDVNQKLSEFSLNLALHEDPRFDEVGPAGEIVWYLQRLEPEAVRQPPVFLRYHPVNYERSILTPEMLALEAELDDELTTGETEKSNPNEAVVRLIYPHWRAGTLPLSNKTHRLFPTAYEAPRIRFTMIAGEEQEELSSWVVRPHRYVFGLREWYLSQGLIPGSLIHIQRSKKAGEVTITAKKHRPTREWIRTVLIGADGGIVFALLKQIISADYDERMAIAIPDVEGLDQVWEQGSRHRPSFENIVVNTMRELAKLNPQGQVHAQELYSAVNIVRRSPPGPIFSLLVSRPWFVHVGDLYFRLDESAQQEDRS